MIGKPYRSQQQRRKARECAITVTAPIYSWLKRNIIMKESSVAIYLCVLSHRVSGGHPRRTRKHAKTAKMHDSSTRCV